MDNCTQITDHCLACGPGEAFWKGYSNAKFPQTPSTYNSYQSNGNPCGCGGIGGINNSKNFRTYASSFTILKKSLTTFQENLGSIPSKSTMPSTWHGSNSRIANPGDAISSVPICIGGCDPKGNKARTIVKPHQTGVDVKHGSYERYLARKRGANMRCQNC